uniref:Uncharacterized protein n=1 Tax=Chelydra serpentina TaxID=8475 RepID=A0A8C3TDX2_CHESE
QNRKYHLVCMVTGRLQQDPEEVCGPRPSATGTDSYCPYCSPCRKSLKPPEGMFELLCARQLRGILDLLRQIMHLGATYM